MQSTIETWVLGTEYVAMMVRMETLYAIQYKLRMMGVPISGPTYIHGDNMSVIHNTSKPKCNAIAYHAISKSVAMRK